MHRLEQIQKLFDTTCANRLSGKPEIKLSPVYYSIYNEDRVERNEDIVRSVTGNPDFIICFVKAPHDWPSGGQYYLEELFCIIDNEGNNIEGITLNEWKLRNLTTNRFDKVETAEFCLVNDPKENLILNLSNLDYNKMINIPELWKFFKEIDQECKNIREVEIYKKYFLAKKESNNDKLLLTEYQNQVYSKNSVLNQYKELLQKFEEIVNNNAKISKT